MTAPTPEPPEFDAATQRELDRAAEVTPEDIERAQEQWRETAPQRFRDLLDAEEDDDNT